MSFSTESNFDAATKVWSGKEEARSYYAADLSIGEIIYEEMRRHPKDVAQISESEKTVLTRGELLQNAIRVATYIRQLGLRQTDVVGIMGSNTTHLAAVVYACFFNGIPFHCLGFRLDQASTRKLYETTKPSLIFCDGEEYDKMHAATSNMEVKIVTMRNHLPGVSSINDVLETALDKDFKPWPLKASSNHILCILNTSGVTGAPKPVPIMHNAKLYNWIALRSTDVQFSHGIGTLDWLFGVLTMVISGIYGHTRVVTDVTIEPAHLLKVIEKHKLSFLVQGPSGATKIVSCPEYKQANLTGIRSYIMGGWRSSTELTQTLRTRLPQEAYNAAYGLTELGGSCTINTDIDKKPGSVGRLLPGYKMKILSETGIALGPNELGEVCIYNGIYWPGYCGNAEATQKIYDKQLWFHTGDMGYVDVDGYLVVVDRKCDVLKYQNNVFYPKEIEEIIAQMPQVAEVTVFGMRNEKVGDEAAAAVSKKPGYELTAQDVITYVEKHVSVKHLQLNAGAIVLEDLLRTPNGKISRRANKEHFLKQKSKL